MDTPDSDLLRPSAVRSLSVEYALAASEILIDARLVAHWQAPEAELEAEFSRRHDWPVDRAARYLIDLRQALSQT